MTEKHPTPTLEIFTPAHAYGTERLDEAAELSRIEKILAAYALMDSEINGSAPMRAVQKAHELAEKFDTGTKDQSVHLFVMSDRDGEVVGAAQVAEAKFMPTNEIQAIAVDPEHQGEGLGSSLLERIEDAAVESGKDMMKLDAVEEQAEWYQKRGYKEVDEVLVEGDVRLLHVKQLPHRQ